MIGKKVRVFSDYNHKTPKYEGTILSIIRDKFIIEKDHPVEKIKEGGHLTTEYPNSCQLIKTNKKENNESI